MEIVFNRRGFTDITAIDFRILDHFDFPIDRVSSFAGDRLERSTGFSVGCITRLVAEETRQRPAVVKPPGNSTLPGKILKVANEDHPKVGARYQTPPAGRLRDASCASLPSDLPNPKQITREAKIDEFPHGAKRDYRQAIGPMQALDAISFR